MLKTNGMLSIRAPVSNLQKKYPQRFRVFLRFLGYNGVLREDALEFLKNARVDSEWVENKLIQFIISQIERLNQGKIAAATIANYYKAIKLFCEMNRAKVFATCNEINRLSKPLQSRFRKLFLPRYTEENFLYVSEKVLSKLSSILARYIGASVWKMEGDIRDVISIGKLARKSDGPQEIELIMKTLTRYGVQKE